MTRCVYWCAYHYLKSFFNEFFLYIIYSNSSRVTFFLPFHFEKASEFLIGFEKISSNSENYKYQIVNTHLSVSIIVLNR